MHYQEHIPHPLLAPHVRCYWTLEDTTPRDDRPAEKIIPDGRMELIVNLADLFTRRMGDVVQSGLRSYLIGEIERHVVAYPARRVHLFGVRFHTGGAIPFLRMPMSELAGSVVGLEDLMGAAARELEERMVEARSNAERIAIVERMLLARLGPGYAGDTLVGVALRSIESRSGHIRIAPLARELGISERQLERRFRAAVGITPKSFSRLARFRRIVATVGRSGLATGDREQRWVELALDAGYADQAHFINDFRAFAGESPARFFAGYHRMSDHFSGLADDDR